MFELQFIFVLVFVFFITIPFGYVREKSTRFSARWFIMIHAPIPFIFAFRVCLDIALTFERLPFLVAIYLLGQYVGKVLYMRFGKK